MLTEGNGDTHREAVLLSNARVRLVQGSPGVGKTYFGCQLAEYELRAKRIVANSNQKILFLTFARNAVAQIRQAYVRHVEASASPGSVREDKQRKQAVLRRVRIDTFSAFSWWLATAYARYIPGHGALRPWLLGQNRIGGEPIPEGHIGYTFNDLHDKACAALGIPAIQALISDVYPLVIVDEHQDVDPVLHKIIRLLSRSSYLVLLRGPGQSVYGSTKGFDPDTVYKQTVDDLAPEEFTIHTLDQSRSRYCQELAAALARYDSDSVTIHDGHRASLRLVPRLNKSGNPNQLDIFAGLAVQKMKKQLMEALAEKPRIAVLTSTNSAAAKVHRTLSKGNDKYKLYRTRATLWFNEEILLQYGRLIFLLLVVHWIAANRSRVNLEQGAATLKALTASASGQAAGSLGKYLQLTEYIATKVGRFQPPRAGQQALDKLKNDLGRLNDELRKPKSKLQKGMPSTPFTQRDIPLLDILRDHVLEQVKPRINYRGVVDILRAHASFEKSIRQKIMLEKSGIQHLVQVMTIHKSKGREFDGVVLILEDDPRALWRASALVPESERIDLYRVAISRAREFLTVVAFDDTSEYIHPSLEKLATKQ